MNDYILDRAGSSRVNLPYSTDTLHGHGMTPTQHASFIYTDTWLG